MLDLNNIHLRFACFLIATTLLAHSVGCLILFNIPGLHMVLNFFKVVCFVLFCFFSWRKLPLIRGNITAFNSEMISKCCSSSRYESPLKASPNKLSISCYMECTEVELWHGMTISLCSSIHKFSLHSLCSLPFQKREGTLSASQLCSEGVTYFWVHLSVDITPKLLPSSAIEKFLPRAFCQVARKALCNLLQIHSDVTLQDCCSTVWATCLGHGWNCICA